VKTEPSKNVIVRKDKRVWKILCEGGIKKFMEACNGFYLRHSL